jgi:DNA mismatch endonuclease, patch repair protein
MHWSPPKSNREWWTTKIARNIKRDRAQDRALSEAGWIVLRIWEHDDVEKAADDVAAVVRSSARLAT